MLIPNSWYLIGGSVALAFMAGMIVGNNRATRMAIDLVQKHDSDEFAKATGKLWSDWNDANKALSMRLDLDRSLDTSAEKAVYEILEGERDAALRDKNAALKQLAREHATMEKMDAAGTSQLNRSVPPCGWSSDARRLLDAAAGATGSATAGGNDPIATSADRAADTAAASAEASCLSNSDLYRGYVELGHWARGAYDKDAAWRAWARERLGALP